MNAWKTPYSGTCSRPMLCGFTCTHVCFDGEFLLILPVTTHPQVHCDNAVESLLFAFKIMYPSLRPGLVTKLWMAGLLEVSIISDNLERRHAQRAMGKEVESHSLNTKSLFTCLCR